LINLETSCAIDLVQTRFFLVYTYLRRCKITACLSSTKGKCRSELWKNSQKREI